jgi:hypothetical protein
LKDVIKKSNDKTVSNSSSHYVPNFVSKDNLFAVNNSFWSTDNSFGSNNNGFANNKTIGLNIIEEPKSFIFCSGYSNFLPIKREHTPFSKEGHFV